MSAGVTTGLVGVLEADVAVGDDDARAARTKAIVGDTLAASGAVAATVGAVLWLTGAGRSEAPAGQVSPWARGPVAGVQVAF